MTALDQGTYLGLGIAGRQDVAAEVRNAGYIGGVFTPVLSTFDTILPRALFSRLGSSIDTENRITLLALSILSGISFSAIFYLLAIYVWNPITAAKFSQLQELAPPLAFAFGAMTARSIIMPYIRIGFASEIFWISIAATTIGFIIILSGNLDSKSITTGFFYSSLVHLGGAILLLALPAKRC